MSETKLTFKVAMQRLEGIVESLERNEIELEEAITLFEEGLSLIKECDNQLHNFDDKVQNILKVYDEGERNE